MFELILGVTLAMIFIAAYVFVSKLFKDETPPEPSSKQISVTLNLVDAERAIGAGQSSNTLLPEYNEKRTWLERESLDHR